MNRPRPSARWVLVGTVVALAAVGATAVVIGRSDPAPTPPVAEGALPYSDPDVVNPMRGQFENILTDLFPQSNRAQSGLPDWPGTRDAAIRVTWRSLQPKDPDGLGPDASDEQRYDFSQIDRALDVYADRGMRVDLRISSYDSCCEQLAAGSSNLAVPDWVAAIPDAVDTYDRGGVTQVIPDWNSDVYLDRFADLLAALGRRYDGDERLSVFEMSGYGDFSENVISILRDELGAPGPAEGDSERELGYFSQYRDQFITAASAQRLVTANLRAFPRTQMVTAPGNPEIVKQLLRDNPALDALAHPVGIRSDCLGVYEVLPTWATNDFSRYVERKDPIIAVLTDRLRTAPVLTEWCQLPDDTSPADYYQKALDVVLDQHVSMTASSGFPDQLATGSMDPRLYDLWRRANVYAGYRYAASADLTAGTGTIGGPVRWTNFGVNSTHERWTVGYQLRDADGEVVASSASGLDLRRIVTSQDAGSNRPTPATQVDDVTFDTQPEPGTYTIVATVRWAEHKADATRTVDYPPMNLAMAGRSDGAYPIGTVTIEAA